MQPNSFLLGRLPLIDGQPAKRGAEPRRSGVLQAAKLADGDAGNALTDALLDDPHLGAFVRGAVFADPFGLGGGENGFEVGGLAVFGRRLFLGLRGPVLRGWAILLEIELEERLDGQLGLAEIGDGGRRYRKHFFDLNGLGIRELGQNGEDLLILAGPTMVLDGVSKLYRVRDVERLRNNHLSDLGSGELVHLYDLPVVSGGDDAEGLSLTTWRGQPAFLVVYERPCEQRRPKQGAVFGDIFWLNG